MAQVLLTDEYVKVTLTELGAKILNQHPYHRTSGPFKEGQKFEELMGTMMLVFGPYMQIGQPLPFRREIRSSR